MLDKNPVLDELLVMKNRMETLYTESFSPAEADGASTGEEQAPWEPAADVWETESEWGVAVDLPGVAETDLRVTIHDGRLSIEGRRTDAGGAGRFQRFHRERPAGPFRRSFGLPSNSRSEGMRAELKKGVLSVVIPKAQSGSRKIQVQPG